MEEEEVGGVAQVLVVVDVEVTAAGSQSLLVFWFGIYRATAVRRISASHLSGMEL
jgi:hypothetical protein